MSSATPSGNIVLVNSACQMQALTIKIRHLDIDSHRNRNQLESSSRSRVLRLLPTHELKAVANPSCAICQDTCPPAQSRNDRMSASTSVALLITQCSLCHFLVRRIVSLLFDIDVAKLFCKTCSTEIDRIIKISKCFANSPHNFQTNIQ